MGGGGRWKGNWRDAAWREENWEKVKKKNKQKGSGAYIICPSTTCTFFRYTSQMPEHEVRCNKCRTLYDRQ